MTVIGELLAGQGVGIALRAVVGGLREFLSQDSLGRLFVLLHADFGERTQLGRDVFYSWRVHDELRSSLERALGGEPATDPNLEALARLVEPRLSRTPESERAALARELAEAAYRAAPFAAEGGSQALALVLNRLEAGQRQLQQAVEGRDLTRPRSTNLGRALLDGPLRHISAADRVAEAEHTAAEGDRLEAARVLQDVADELDRRGLHVAGESLRERSAAYFAAGGEVDRAAELLVGITLARIERGSGRGWVNLQLLRDLLPSDVTWLADALEARANWPERGDAALGPLAVAATSSANRADHAEWVAAHVELLMVHERYAEALAAGDALGDQPLREGARLRSALDVAEAFEMTGNTEAAERQWLEILRWADDAAPPIARAAAWQRRAVMFARRDEVLQAHDAYRRAIASWAEVPGYDEQAGDAFLSMQSVSLANASPPEDLELRPVAAELRGSPNTPAARAERLERDAMSARLRGQLPDALTAYWRALLIHRRIGSFVGVWEVTERLAELYSHAGEHAVALALYIHVGNGNLAADLAAPIDGPTLAEAVGASMTRWERAARYTVLGSVGGRMPETYIAEIAEELLTEAAQTASTIVHPQPSLSARRALAAVALALPERLRPRGWEQLRQDLSHRLIDIARAAANAFVLATSAGLVDARGDLVDRFLDDPYNAGVSVAWLAREVEKDAALRERIQTAARDDNAGALGVLAAAEAIRGDRQLEAAATQATNRAAEIVTYQEALEDGERTVGMGIDFAEHGLVARAASPSARGRLLDRLLEIVRDHREPEGNRASAAQGLFNLAPALDGDQASRVATQLRPLAIGEYQASEFDQNIDHPLSRVRVIVHTPQQLRASAIGTLAQLIAKHRAVSDELLVPAIDQAFRDGSEQVIGAAFDAGARLPDLALPVAPEDGLFHPTAEVRLHA